MSEVQPKFVTLNLTFLAVDFLSFILQLFFFYFFFFCICFFSLSFISVQSVLFFSQSFLVLELSSNLCHLIYLRNFFLSFFTLEQRKSRKLRTERAQFEAVIAFFAAVT